MGNPGRSSPVLLTCNFFLTVERLKRILRKLDAWLVVADSKGINVWCAAGADEFNTHSVVSALKTSGIGDEVDHRTVILPPLGGPGIRAVDIGALTGWSPRWGPVRMEDLPRFLAGGSQRDEPMKRVTFGWRERLDAGLGSLFILYLAGAAGFAALGSHLLVDYLLVGAVTFLFFMLASPWIPGKRGVTKVLVLDLVLGVVLLATWFFPQLDAAWLRADLVIAMAMLLVYGFELGGLASTMTSDLDPLLHRLGVGAWGNLEYPVTLRNELLRGRRQLVLERNRCLGCGRCDEICPRHVWKLGEDGRARLSRPERCTACRACLVQCEPGAIQTTRQG